MIYAKKLEKAEAAAGYYYTFIAQIVSVQKSYEGVIKAITLLGQDQDVTVLQNIINSNLNEI